MSKDTLQTKEAKIIFALESLFKQKGVSKEEVTGYLEEAFNKAYSRDGIWEPELEEADIEVKVDIDNGLIDIKRIWTVVEEIEPTRLYREVKVGTLDADDQPVGTRIVEEIDIDNMSISKAQHIKQLLIQKTRESEKQKLFDQFKDRQGELMNVNVFKIEDNYVILSKEDTSIFVPSSELSPLDNIKVGEKITVYVINVDDKSRDAQIIGSRTNPMLVSKLIERSVEDVQDGIIKIEAIAREPGIKTKLSVSSTLPEVDPVGSIIGVRGSKIKTIIDEIGGERIDVVKHSDDVKQLVVNALSPARITGIKLEIDPENEERQIITVVTEEDQFLATIGKRGSNVKLAARLAGVKIEVKTIEQAKEAGIEYEEVDHSQDHTRSSSYSNMFEFETLNSDNYTEVTKEYDTLEWDPTEVKKEEPKMASFDEDDFISNDDLSELPVQETTEEHQSDIEDEDIFGEGFDEYEEEQKS